MKKILVTLTLCFSLFSMSSFAGEDKVSPEVLHAFKNSFKQATEVDWSVTETYFKVNFSLNGQYVSAFYATEDGHMIALTRNITSTQLPIGLQTKLKQSYDGFWITDLIEVANEEGTQYYVTVENADDRVTLKSSGSDWGTYQKQRKS